MITLVTGTPGAGKTLWSVAQLVEKYLPAGRPIFTNIEGLTLDSPLVTLVDDECMKKWPEYPDGSVFFFDECQSVYRPRAAGSKVPDFIAGFETHRHRGMDFYMITQFPGFIDKNIRELVGRHVHHYRPWGLGRSQMFEWPTYNAEPNPSQTSATAMRKNFVFPKKLYGVYKSSAQHTMKLNLPWKLFAMIGGGLLVMLIAGFLVMSRLGAFPQGDEVKKGFPDEATKSRSQETPFSPGVVQVTTTCRLRGRVGHILLLDHSIAGKVSVPQESVLEVCGTVY